MDDGEAEEEDVGGAGVERGCVSRDEVEAEVEDGAVEVAAEDAELSKRREAACSRSPCSAPASWPAGPSRRLMVETDDDGEAEAEGDDCGG